MKLDEVFFCFFFNDTATTEIYTLSLHDALPICQELRTALYTQLEVKSNRNQLHEFEASYN